MKYGKEVTIAAESCFGETVFLFPHLDKYLMFML